jgi:hypothetical protein
MRRAPMGTRAWSRTAGQSLLASQAGARLKPRLAELSTAGLRQNILWSPGPGWRQVFRAPTRSPWLGRSAQTSSSAACSDWMYPVLVTVAPLTMSICALPACSVSLIRMGRA